MLEKRKSFKQHFARYSTITFQHIYEIFMNAVSDDLDLGILIKKLDELNPILEANNSLFVISDLRTITYPYISKSCKTVFGYSPEEWTSKGLAFYSDNYCQADVKSGEVFLKQILKHNASIPNNEKPDYSYVTTYRFFHKNGYFVWLYNRWVFSINDEKGKAILTLTLITSIDSFKTNDNCSLHIIKIDNRTGELQKTEVVKAPVIATFNNSELQILTLLSHGKNNGEIAKELHLSEHTIKDYRKKMLKKTWCSNTVELIYFALRNGLIQ